MEQKSISKTDIIFAGLGGMGVLMAGRILSLAALNKYKYVSWLPSYGVEKRGGLCECTVVYSDRAISSPLINQARTVIMLDPSQFNVFKSRVRPGGMLFIESSGMEDEQELKEYSLLKVPGRDASAELGESHTNSLLFLGAFIGKTNSIPTKMVETEIEKRFKNNQAVLERNINAFRKGIELGADL